MLNRFDLTTKLKIKIIFIVTLFMFMVITYGLWTTLQTREKECSNQLEAITAFLVSKMPPDSFANIVNKQGATGKSIEEQVAAINKEIQPILANVLIPLESVKFGIHSRYHQRNVAIGPDLDSSLLIAVDTSLFVDMYKNNIPQMGESKNSIVWYGAPVIYHMRPIVINGQITGHAFASINLNKVYADFWAKTINIFAVVIVALLVAIMLFQEVFIRLKKELRLFAEAIIKGRAKHFESNIAELTPVLQYISDQTENMARLDRLNVIGEMAASIGHEVRNPMTTVRGYLQYLGSKKQFESFHEQFALMISELDRANSIITKYLSLAKNKKMDFQDTSLNKVIAEAAPLMQADAIRENCQVKLFLADIPLVRIDENSILQLIINMVRNAIEAMPQGGTVTIRTIDNGSAVLLTVSDQGVGMTSEFMDNLGTPFITTKDDGIGLGLAVCYRVAQRHRATITVDSRQGIGSIFTIAFNYIIKAKN